MEGFLTIIICYQMVTVTTYGVLRDRDGQGVRNEELASLLEGIIWLLGYQGRTILVVRGHVYVCATVLPSTSYQVQKVGP